MKPKPPSDSFTSPMLRAFDFTSRPGIAMVRPEIARRLAAACRPPEAPVPDSPLVACECCKGAGMVPLRGDLLRTYRQLETERPLMVSAMLEDGVSSNAINNRLVALEKLGLARRRGKCGKWVMWLRANI